MSMAVYVPVGARRGLHPDVVPAIIGAGYAAFVYPMVGDATYSEWLARWWRTSMTLCIVEHDVIVDRAILKELDQCRQAWCCHPYNDLSLLGCTRFRPPGLPAPPGQFPWVGKPWPELDGAVYQWLHEQGQEPHRHERRARHEHSESPDLWTPPAL